jgi:hypothetical protein
MAANHGRILSKGLAVIGAAPLMCLVVFSFYKELPRLLVDDPCFVWGETNTTQLSAGRPPCEHFIAGTSETKVGALVQLTAVQGSILMVTVLALVGAVRSRPLLCSAAFLMLLVVSVPLMMLGGLRMITLVCASFFLPSCPWTRARES